MKPGKQDHRFQTIHATRLQAGWMYFYCLLVIPDSIALCEGEKMNKLISQSISIFVAFALAFGGYYSAGASSATASILVGSGIWISQSELMSRPVSGAAWKSVLSNAGASWGSASVSDQNSNHEQYVLAGAFVCARTNQYCDKTRQGLLSAIGTEEGSRWLAIGRNMLGYTIAADVMRNSGNLTDADLSLVSIWIASFLTRTLADNNSGAQIMLTPFSSGSNASAQEGAVYAAIAAYTDNTTKLNYAWNRFRLYSCDKTNNPETEINIKTGFNGGWSYASTYTEACAVNPKDTTKNGIRIDGAVINDIVRGGSFQWPPVWTGYEWTGLQGYVPAALILSRAGYSSLEVKDRAVLRAVDYVCFLENNTSTSWWEPSRASAIKHLIKAVYGYTPAGCDISYPIRYGMTIGYTDWTHPTGAISITPTALATFTPTATHTLTPTASATPIFIPTLTSTMTATATNTPGSSPTSTATNTPLPNLIFADGFTATNTPLPNLIFANGFESGNSSDWSSASSGGGDLSVSPSAALMGSNGMQVAINDTTNLYVNDDTPNAEQRYRARFYFDPNSITMTDGNFHSIFTGYDATGMLHVDFRFSGRNYQIRLRQYNDSSSSQSTNWTTISDALHSIEMEWWAATAAGANNGGVNLWIDGVQSGSLSGVDNDTRRIDSVRLGAVTGVDATTLGAYYLDAFESRRQTYIGP